MQSPLALLQLFCAVDDPTVFMDAPWRELPEAARQVVLQGSKGEKIRFVYDDNARKYEVNKTFEGVLPNLERRWRETDSAWVREELGRYQSEIPCEACEGYRLKPEALAVKIADLHIGQASRLSIEQAGPLGSVVQWVYGGLTDRYLAMEAAGLKQWCEADATPAA